MPKLRAAKIKGSTVCINIYPVKIFICAYDHRQVTVTLLQVVLYLWSLSRGSRLKLVAMVMTFWNF